MRGYFVRGAAAGEGLKFSGCVHDNHRAMARLMILEPHCDGHRMRYVRWLAKEAVARGYSLQLATFANCLSDPMYLLTQTECGRSLTTFILPEMAGLQTGELMYRAGRSSRHGVVKSLQDTFDLIRRELVYRKLFSASFRQLSRSERPDFVFVPYLDYCAHAIALLGSPFGETPWGGIVLRPSFHLKTMEIPSPKSVLHPLKRRLFLRLLGNGTLRVLFTIDEALVSYISRRNRPSDRKLRFLPDPAEFHGTVSRQQARQRLNIPDDKVLLLVYGAQNRRKGIDSLLRATQEGDFPKNVVILLAGAQHLELKEELLASSQAKALREAGRLHEYDTFLSDEDEYTVFRAADAVWLGYREHYAMSAVLVQAGMMGLPVIACAEGLVGYLTRKHKLGLCVSIEDTLAVARAVEKLSHDHRLAARCGNNGRRAFSAYTPGHFAQVILGCLELEGSTEKVTKESHS